MLKQYLGHFFGHIFFSRERQRLLILAVVGLFISSFALLVLQSTMGGLQHKLIGRSQDVFGRAVFELEPSQKTQNDRLLMALADSAGANQFFVPEYEVEVLIRQGEFVSPVILHGQDFQFHRPLFMAHALNPPDEAPEKKTELILGADLAYKMRTSLSQSVRLMSPAHTDTVLLGEVPRAVSTSVQDTLRTNVPEADQLHAWTRLSLVQNLVRERGVNRVRLYGDWSLTWLQELLQEKFPKGHPGRLLSWEDQNQTLVWALRLETSVMVFLFMAMTMLVSLCITSGLMIFFNKVKVDLASFWILGASRAQLDRANAYFLSAMSFISVVMGLIFGGLALYVLDQYGGNIMPAGFVDRKIPVHVTPLGLAVSFWVPFGISLVFSFFSLYQFKRDNNFLDTVRSVG